MAGTLELIKEGDRDTHSRYVSVGVLIAALQSYDKDIVVCLGTSPVKSIRIAGGKLNVETGLAEEAVTKKERAMEDSLIMDFFGDDE